MTAGPYYVEAFPSPEDIADDIDTPEWIVDSRNANRLTQAQALAEVLNQLASVQAKVQEGLAQIEPVMGQLKPMLTMLGI